MIPRRCDFDSSNALSPTCALGPFCDHGSVIICVKASFSTPLFKSHILKNLVGENCVPSTLINPERLKV